MERTFLALGAVLAALSVGLGAYAAHGLREVLDERSLQVFQTGAQYQMYHSLGIILVGLTLSRVPGGLTTASGWLLLAGIVLFSGSLYALALTGVTWLGAITPVGGLAFIAGWLLLAGAVLRPS